MLPRHPVSLAALALVLGFLVGVLTSLLQAGAEFPWLALVNAVSPWLTTAFVAGALQTRLRVAVLIGMAATFVQVVGYYVTAEVRGFDANLDYVLLWSACAVLGGPLFGAAGHLWRRAAPAGVGASLLAATYAAEAVVSYGWRLGYTSSAVLFGAIALGLALGLGWHRGQLLATARWAGPALVAGFAGHFALGLVV